MLDIQQIRSEFPILQQSVNGKPLIYFDNAATNHKPVHVIDAISNYYKTINSNVHRGVHTLSQLATDACEQARITVQEFIHAKHHHEIIFTRGTTESINLVASSFGKKFLTKGDEILISAMEHHSNIVPWQMICEEQGATLRVIPVTQEGEIIFSEFEKLLNPKIKLIAITHISNVLGTINPVKNIVKTAHLHKIPVLIDGAQSIAHAEIDVQELDCDFYVFSGHKIYGPTGIGVLYGKEQWLNDLPPYQGGGSMIKQVSFEKTTYNELPFKFEAGTPDIAGVIGLAAAINYVKKLGIKAIQDYEHELLTYASEKMQTIDGITYYGTAKEKASLISFLMGHIHAFDAGTILDKLGIAIRTGHHCAQPLMHFFGIAGTMRASFAIYNTKEEIDIFVEGLKKAKAMLS